MNLQDFEGQQERHSILKSCKFTSHEGRHVPRHVHHEE